MNNKIKQCCDFLLGRCFKYETPSVLLFIKIKRLEASLNGIKIYADVVEGEHPIFTTVPGRQIDIDSHLSQWIGKYFSLEMRVDCHVSFFSTTAEIEVYLNKSLSESRRIKYYLSLFREQTAR